MPRTDRILFSIPTLSDDIAALEPLQRQPAESDLIFHEDDWAQLEFLPRERLVDVQRMLMEFKAFERAHRVPSGWTEVYIRRLQRAPVLPDLDQLEQVLATRAGPAPLLHASSGISGAVAHGFSIPLGGNIHLYGYTEGKAIPVLGASVGRDPDDLKLTEAFMKLSASHGLILVDWRGQLVLTGVASSGQIDAWRP